MSKILTDNNLIEKFLTRGVENSYPNKKFIEDRLKEGKKLTMYLGIDPTGPTLHLGHAIALKKLKTWQEMGHQVVMLVGSFTGMVGDPTDKSAARKQLTRQQVLDNAKKYKKQANTFIKFTGDNPAKIVYNHKWLDKLSFKDVVELASNFTVQQMLQRDMFQERLRKREFECKKCGHIFVDSGDISGIVARGETRCLKCGVGANYVSQTKGTEPIYLHEFLYPLMQGYDSVELNTDGEIGGNDQTFNMLAGRDLMKAMKKKEKFVLTMKLLVDPAGEKMGKTTSNMITLDDNAEDIYGKAMSYSDSMIIIGLELLTDISTEVIKNIEQGIKDGENPMQYKKMMAFEIVKTIKGKEEAQTGQKHFENTVQKKETPSEVRSKKLEVRNINIVELLVECNLVSSKGEARRLIEQGGIKVNGDIVKSIDKKVEITKKSVLVQRGKRQFVKVVKK